jgi:hypothetical protein
VSDYHDMIREMVDDMFPGITAPTGRFWGSGEAPVFTRETLEAAFDEIRYGPLPTVEDVLNDGLEPDMGVWREHPHAAFAEIITPKPMAFLKASDLIPDRDDHFDALRYAMYAQRLVKPSTRIVNIDGS